MLGLYKKIRGLSHRAGSIFYAIRVTVHSTIIERKRQHIIHVIIQTHVNYRGRSKFDSKSNLEIEILEDS